MAQSNCTDARSDELSGSAARRDYDLPVTKTGALLLLTLTLACCASSEGEEEREREERRSAPNRALARALNGPLNDFRVRVEWARGGRMQSAEFYGSGAAIWNDESAFRADIAPIAAAIREAKFAAMPERFGEAESDFLTMRGKVSVAVGDAAKTVVQLDRGPQSDALAQLAAAVLARAEAGGRAGVGAESLADGLQKIRVGVIPAEALRVSVQQRGEGGFLLHVKGGEATARRFNPKGGYGPARRMRVDVRDVAMPEGVVAPAYTELRIEVLGKAEERIARPEQRGAPLDVEPWRAIAERTLREGKPAPAAD
jgi:hypothetical protein